MIFCSYFKAKAKRRWAAKHLSFYRVFPTALLINRIMKQPLVMRKVIERYVREVPKVRVVYISGAYSKGDVAQNVKHAIDAADKLAEAGWIPFIPHLTHFWHIVSPHPWDFWIEIDLELLKRCDAIYLLKSFRQSSGAMAEYRQAQELGLEVFYEDKLDEKQ